MFGLFKKKEKKLSLLQQVYACEAIDNPRVSRKLEEMISVGYDDRYLHISKKTLVPAKLVYVLHQINAKGSWGRSMSGTYPDDFVESTIGVLNNLYRHKNQWSETDQLEELQFLCEGISCNSVWDGTTLSDTTEVGPYLLWSKL
jgi:hypothetical protein